MEENERLYKVKTADGRNVGIYKDKTHYRAYDAEKKLVGEPRVNLAQLLTDLGATLEGNQSPKPEEPAAKKREEKKLGEAETADKNKLTITYDGSHFRAYDVEGTLVGAPYVLFNSLLPAVKAVLYTAMDPAVKRETPPETQQAPVGETKNETDTPAPETKDTPSETDTPATGTETTTRETQAQREEREFNEALAAETKAKASKVPAKRK